MGSKECLPYKTFAHVHTFWSEQRLPRHNHVFKFIRKQNQQQFHILRKTPDFILKCSCSIVIEPMTFLSFLLSSYSHKTIILNWKSMHEKENKKKIMPKSIYLSSQRWHRAQWQKLISHVSHCTFGANDFISYKYLIGKIHSHGNIRYSNWKNENFSSFSLAGCYPSQP